jgi:hypothetical protein
MNIKFRINSRRGIRQHFFSVGDAAQINEYVIDRPFQAAFILSSPINCCNDDNPLAVSIQSKISWLDP